MADSTSSPAPTCDVDGTCYCPLTGVIDTLSQKYAMQLISIIGAHESLRFGAIEGHLSSASNPSWVGLDGRVTAVDILPRVNTRESHGTSPESESCTSLTTTTRSAR